MVSKRRKNAALREPTLVTENKIHTGCSTRTFIAKSAAANAGPRMSVEELLEALDTSSRTKFRNCVIKKVDKICVKIYTNKTVQITGAKNLEDIPKILSEDLPFDEEYEVVCVMSNWSVNLENEGIDLNSTMDRLNEAGMCSYFLRGFPLVNKYQTVTDKMTYKMVKNPETQKYYIKETREEKNLECQVSMLMFKSGTCIVSGLTESACAEFLMKIKPLIVKAEKD